MSENDNGKLTVKEYVGRLGISYATFQRKMKEPNCPKVEVVRGKKRIRFITPIPQLDAFLLEDRRQFNGH